MRKLRFDTIALWAIVMASVASNWKRIKQQLSLPKILYWLVVGAFALFMTFAIIHSFGLLPDLLQLAGFSSIL